MEEYQKGWLGTLSFIGMMIGALVWGIMGDRLGRRRTLLTALVSNGIFGVIAAFMPTYSLLMLTRFCSSVGIGGSLPIVFTFYSEFLVRKNRGRYLSFLLVFWALGGLFVAVLAWGIIPRSGATILDMKRLHFARWRKFLLICSIPAILSAIGVSFLPESPRFLLEMGRNSEAIYVYKQIFSWNNSVKSGEEYQCWNNIAGVFSPPNTFLTLFLLMVWITMSFGFYGISIWLHEYTKYIEDNNFESRTINQANLIIEDRKFATNIENTHFTNLTFNNVRFDQTLINHCGCDIDFDVNFKLAELFYENLFAQLAILPGTLITSFILDRIGRIKTLGVSLVLTSASVGCLWFANTKEYLIAFEAVFTFLTVFGWNALDVMTTEAYPANIRTTSYGIFSAISRLAAILSNLTFGSTVQVSKLIPFSFYQRCPPIRSNLCHTTSGTKRLFLV
ncbi:synaptic vesicle glycoprotein 2C [Caerostris darwini]|uniref:Synaptic vesicle glycoprotein 2C n=1 Tax=Caerostris darwini TaxID=1538125 RepID=A0AAV4VQF5_9ARAC|nr:synaptic vesicle glycoprotein 2C [Caerostris darwini]